VALIEGVSGFVLPCDWLQLDRLDLGGDAPTTVAWVRGTASSQLVVPPGWRPGNVQRMSIRQLKDEHDLIEVRDGVEAYRHRETGAIIYVGRTRLPAGRRWWQFWK
jgi:hypothetical protein